MSGSQHLQHTNKHLYKLQPMAEAPPPPSNMGYNAFRTWRKDNGIKSTVQELSEAWASYSGGRQSPSKKSPSKKKSPNKSPLKYGGFLSANLLGVPKEVSAMITGQVGAKEVQPLIVASKGTAKLAKENLTKICEENLTQLEILNGLDRIPFPVGVRVVILSKEGVVRYITFLIVTKKGDKVKVRTKTGSEYEKHTIGGKNPIKKFITEHVRQHEKKWFGSAWLVATPLTVKHLYLRRLSCMTPDYATRVKEYARQYFRSWIVVNNEDAATTMPQNGVEYLNRIEFGVREAPQDIGVLLMLAWWTTNPALWKETIRFDQLYNQRYNRRQQIEPLANKVAQGLSDAYFLGY